MLVMPTEVELEVVLRDQEELGVDVEVLEEVGAGEVGDVVELLSLFRTGSRADSDKVRKGTCRMNIIYLFICTSVCMHEQV